MWERTILVLTQKEIDDQVDELKSRGVKDIAEQFNGISMSSRQEIYLSVTDQVYNLMGARCLSILSGRPCGLLYVSSRTGNSARKGVSRC